LTTIMNENILKIFFLATLSIKANQPKVPPPISFFFVPHISPPHKPREERKGKKPKSLSGCSLRAHLLGHLVSLLNHLVDAANHVEGVLWEVVVFAVRDGIERLDAIGNVDVSSG